MMHRFKKLSIISGLLVLTQFPQISFGQQGSWFPFDGIDSVRGIGWRFSPGFSLTDPEWKIKTDYDLIQSDYLVVKNCADSSIIYTFPWKIPQHCLDYYEENKELLKRDTLLKNFKICWEDYYNDISNKARRDTVFINPNNSALMEPTRGNSQEKVFFERREIHFSPNSSDSIVIEFYSLEEVKNECTDGYNFRRKFLKMYGDGKPDGTWLEYDKHGHLIRETEYEKGVIIKDEVY